MCALATQLNTRKALGVAHEQNETIPQLVSFRATSDMQPACAATDEPECREATEAHRPRLLHLPTSRSHEETEVS